ncbi:hypothetical protein [Christiangramia aquimixticola]|uniref:hypothetical protein n=1 Tax=Christiangramia aquimixticola TaxID=1697558 RepID=UPI003AA7F0C6
MKNLFFLVFMFTGLVAHACSCDIPNTTVEMYSSEYVFQGVAVQKTVTSDSTSYHVKFRITELYKGTPTKEFMEFELPYPKEGVNHSCYWEVEKGETWLIFAVIENDKLKFYNNCSNSTKISTPLNQDLKQVLEHGKDLNISKYTFTALDGINTVSRPKKNIDSLLGAINSQKFKSKRVDIIIDIDKDGHLISANLHAKKFENRPEKKIIDTIFNLNKPENIQVRNPENQAEIDLLKLVRSLKDWDKVYIPNSNTSIRFRQYLQFHKDKAGWKIYY